MRLLLDKIFRASIKLCMLTGVAFTVTACYGPYYEPSREDEKYWQEQQQLEQQLEEQAEQQPVQ